MNIKNKSKRTTDEIPTLFVVAGGSGGHILPAIQFAKHWYDENNQNGQIYFFCHNTQFDQKLTEQSTFLHSTINLKMGKFKPRKPLSLILLLIHSTIAFCKSIIFTLRLKPKKIITTGGLIAIPLCLAGRVLGIEIELYELNVEPGKAINFLLPMATKIYTVFDKTKKLLTKKHTSLKHRIIKTKYPVRFSKKEKVYDTKRLLSDINTMLTKKQSHLPFTQNRKTIFILGGSQGSVYLNSLSKKLIQEYPLLEMNIQIIHQTGAEGVGGGGNLSQVSAKQVYRGREIVALEDFYRSKNVPALTFSYTNSIKLFYQQADLIICRAGAGTLFELLFFNKQSIVIPLIASTTSHQVVNAREMADQFSKFFTVVEPQSPDVDVSKVCQAIIKILDLAFTGPEKIRELSND
jgi:UDP-N-acetylglucosamine--N-acetylmuramyl-(pentapeptide) pyrophosphoryl-undecaprenol N-acetylglucosamine transferase